MWKVHGCPHKYYELYNDIYLPVMLKKMNARLIYDYMHSMRDTFSCLSYFPLTNLQIKQNEHA